MLKQLLATLLKTFNPSKTPFAQMFMSGADTLPSTTTLQYPYAQHPTVYTATSRIATSISQLEREVFPLPLQKGTDPLDEHWVLDLLDAPTETMEGGQLIEAIVAFRELKGEAHLWHRDIKRGGSSLPLRPHELWMLPPDAMWPDLDRDGALKGWLWNSPKGQRRIPLEEHTYLKQWNPHDPIRGLSTLSAAYLEYTGDYRAALWNRAFFDNSALPAMVFKSKAPRWPLTERERLIESWEAKHRGAPRAGQAAALPAGVDVEILKLTQHEMEFLQGRKFSREQILGIFGVPPVIAGVFEFANYANSREQQKLYWTVKLLPIVNYTQRVLTTKLLHRYDPMVALMFKTDPVLAEIMAKDFNDKVQTAQRLWAMGWSAKDINERLQLNMQTDGRPWLEIGFLPLNVLPAEDLIIEDEEEPLVEPDDDEEPIDGEEEEDEDEETPPPGPSPPQGPSENEESVSVQQRGKEAKRRARSIALRKQWLGVSRAINRRFRNTMFEMKKETLQNIDDIIVGIEEAGKAHWSMQKDFDDFILANNEKFERKFRTIGRTGWKKAIAIGGEGVMKESKKAAKEDITIGIDFNALDDRILSFLADKDIKIISVPRRIRRKVREKARVLVATGIAEGQSTKELSKVLKSEVSKIFTIERRRAIVWARTETIQAFNIGRDSGMEQAGVQEKEWLTSRDTRVRELHEEMDGERVGIRDTFSNGLQFPGDPGGPPEEVIQCRCNSIPAGTAD